MHNELNIHLNSSSSAASAAPQPDKAPSSPSAPHPTQQPPQPQNIFYDSERTPPNAAPAS